MGYSARSCEAIHELVTCWVNTSHWNSGCLRGVGQAWKSDDNEFDRLLFHGAVGVCCDASRGLITPQPMRVSGSRPCTARSKARGTSGTRSGKLSLIGAGGVPDVSVVGQTMIAP